MGQRLKQVKQALSYATSQRIYQGQLVLRGFAHLAYAQEGEDMILRRMFEGRASGFYIDVGAHHPTRFSNTYYFYTRGWSGINIDAAPGSMALFKRVRPRDINIEAAVAKDRGELTFYVFNEPALNTFDEDLARSRNGQSGYRIVREQTITTTTLADILTAHLTERQQIDILSVDVEGLDLAVLQSNNWTRFRPRCVLVECLDANVCEVVRDDRHRFLATQGYELFAKTVNTAIFRSREVR